MRNEYLQGRGVPWHVGGSTTSRQQASRSLSELVAGGLATSTGTATRATHAGLTPAGAARARGLAGLHSTAATVDLIQRMRSIAPAGKWIPELTLAGTEWGSKCDYDALRKIEEIALPALEMQLMRSASTTRGHVCYTLTTMGYNLVKFPEFVDTSIDEERAAWENYYAKLKESISSLGNVDRDPRELGILPLPMASIQR